MTSTPPYLAGLDFTPAARADAVAVMRRLMTHFEHKSTDQADAQYVEPITNYRDPHVWQREMATIHHRVPLPVALSAELPEPGSHKAMDVQGTPVLLTRDRNGEVHAMLNVCRHRGAELVAPGRGRANRISCPYHAWSYDLSGNLAAVYGEETFGPIDKPSMGLRTLPVAERAGFVFICLDRDATIDLDTWLGDLAPLLDSLGLDKCVHHATTYLPGPNWKLVIDGYLEGYHFASLHRTTVFRTNHSNMAVFDGYGPHMRVAFALKTIGAAVDTPESTWQPPTAVGPIFWLFPGIAIAGGWRKLVEVSIVLPGSSPDTSMTEQHLLLRRPPADDDEVKEADHASQWFYEVTLEEDYRTGAGIQRGLAAGAEGDFVFGRNEPGVQHFHRTIATMLAGRDEVSDRSGSSRP